MKKKLSLILICFAFLTSIVKAIDFKFSHVGFEEGASISGVFSGEDTDFNGFIGTSEVTNFTMQWSGNSLVPAFVLNLSDLLGFGYSLNDGPILGDMVFEGIVGLNSGVYIAGEGGFSGLGISNPGVGGLILSGTNASATLDLPTVTVTRVPDSSVGNALLGLALLSLFGGAQRWSSRK